MPTEELAAFSGAITDEALFFQGVFALHQSAQLDLKVYQAYLDWFVCIVATPGGKAWWNIVAKPIFLSDMVEEIDQRPSRGEIPDIRKLPRLSVEEWSGV